MANIRVPFEVNREIYLRMREVVSKLKFSSIADLLIHGFLYFEIILEKELEGYEIFAMHKKTGEKILVKIKK